MAPDFEIELSAAHNVAEEGKGSQERPPGNLLLICCEVSLTGMPPKLAETNE